MSTEKSSLPLPESGKYWKDLESIKNHFSWKHHIINEIKSWKLWNPCRIFSKCFVWSEHLWTIIASNLYFTNYEASIISIHFTLPLHISAFDLRFHSSSTSMLWRKWSACSPQLTQDQRCWPRSLQVSDGRELVIFSVNCSRTPHNLVKSSAFYTRCCERPVAAGCA